MNTYLIEYEIPPLRAIYQCECDAEDKAQAREHFLKVKDKPRHVIRKITKASASKPALLNRSSYYDEDL
jgi:hypothetical protein